MKYSLAYDRGEISIDLPADNVVRSLAYKEATPLENPQDEFESALLSPIGSLPLVALAANKRSACILICDITRPVPNQLMLTPILRTLEDAGIHKRDITILVATGLHRPSTPEELREMVGEKIVGEYRIENHVGQDTDAHDFLGMSPNGVPIWIDRRYLAADLKVTVGLIEPHFMAGYSGGRKLICPGIAGFETIKAWHSPKFLEHPNAAAGILKDNPVHVENSWIAERAGCDFIANVVIDTQRRPLKFVVGDMHEAFHEGVDFVRELVTDSVDAPVDIVVTSGAGYPLDTTFYQSVKGMVGAASIVRPGGTIILAAGMTEGIGSPEFQQIFDDHPTLEGFMDHILHRDYFQMDQWQLEELAKARRQANIKVVTDGLPPEVINRLYVSSSPSVEQAVSDCLSSYGPQASIAVIPKGPYVMATVA